ncbi:Phenylalanyl-tRNA synthetase beta chain (EC 6.1.1.20) [uncultured Gammaproteobacteria bacterium]|uniref:phenylalanine--tRNA ligase subunit beta n=1 Tax=Bathymodiolus heckerae thiotrophic gill symbiont TaxID=1052212 RepID=UPI0010AF798D|nr:phenylalanine--tRNA ligase subunit beta [Bathymodiolus heckerae thiotrophic gill symbiont]CAC9607918.1 Phenylalanyl-tRNA synthetase beta chain (EC 6.1.1.20) [uncultured Gammaproteobacteria bacterium]SHN92970.1 Phenylalanyl-tRNA synthetase beta chain [Bathymodiolus heckerae thiotrophic gill symbiont]
MNISTSWLREWISPVVTDEVLAEQLTMAGLEVDSIQTVAPAFNKVVAGHVVTCEKHPDADKLNLCQVDIGEADLVQIICGAKNVRTGLKVITALVGANLPGDFKIKKAKLRGVESFGMICSESELGMSGSSDGIAELNSEAPIGQDIREYLDLDDNIIELDITPNRGDCFSVLGVAREVSANYGMAFVMPEINVTAQGESSVDTSVSNTAACPKYLTRTIKGIDNSVQTPKWMSDKLSRSGQATHSPVVDITNYVLMELGQPLHAFDLAKINGSIEVRNAKSGETIDLLNDSTATLKENTLVIADEKSVLAIAGVMGGESSSTQVTTTDILLESAFFEPVSLAGKARDYGLHTESSLRFERGVDFNITELALDRATQLVVEVCGGAASEITSNIDKSALPELAPITITKAKIQKILGFELDSNWIEEKFINLDFEISNKTPDSWTIIPPSFRFDIRIPADLIEELARLYGYDKLPVQKLSLDANINAIKEDQIDKYDVMQALVSRGYQEVITYSFISEKYQDLIDPSAKKIALTNPISADMSTMRSSLWAGLLQTVESNQRRGHTDARFFEIGLCFDGVKADEQSNKLAGIITGNRFEAQWSEELQALDFFDAKADLESLLSLTSASFAFEAAERPALQKGQSAKITLNGKPVGWIGALSPVVQKELSLPKCYLYEIDLEVVLSGNISKYQPFSSYQQAQRDIALVVDQSTPVAQLTDAINELNQVHFVGVSLFDVYQGEHIETGKKSVALNLAYQSLEATLADDEVNAKVDEVLALMKNKFGATLR